MHAGGWAHRSVLARAAPQWPQEILPRFLPFPVAQKQHRDESFSETTVLRVLKERAVCGEGWMGAL